MGVGDPRDVEHLAVLRFSPSGDPCLLALAVGLYPIDLALRGNDVVVARWNQVGSMRK